MVALVVDTDSEPVAGSVPSGPRSQNRRGAVIKHPSPEGGQTTPSEARRGSVVRRGLIASPFKSPQVDDEDSGDLRLRQACAALDTHGGVCFDHCLETVESLLETLAESECDRIEEGLRDAVAGLIKSTHDEVRSFATETLRESREKLKAKASWYEMKIDAARRAGSVLLKNQAIEQEGSFKKKLAKQLATATTDTSGAEDEVAELRQKVQELGLRASSNQETMNGAIRKLSMAQKKLAALEETHASLTISSAKATEELERVRSELKALEKRRVADVIEANSGWREADVEARKASEDSLVVRKKLAAADGMLTVRHAELKAVGAALAEAFGQVGATSPKKGVSLDEQIRLLAKAARVGGSAKGARPPLPSVETADMGTSTEPIDEAPAPAEQERAPPTPKAKPSKERVDHGPLPPRTPPDQRVPRPQTHPRRTADAERMALEADLVSAKKRMADLEAELAGAREEIAKLEAGSLAGVSDDGAMRVKELEAQMKRMGEEGAKAVKAAEARLKEAKEAAKRKAASLEAQLTEAREEAQKVSSSLKAELKELKAALEARAKASKEALSQQEAEAEQRTSELRAQMQQKYVRDLASGGREIVHWRGEAERLAEELSSAIEETAEAQRLMSDCMDSLAGALEDADRNAADAGDEADAGADVSSDVMRTLPELKASVSGAEKRMSHRLRHMCESHVQISTALARANRDLSVTSEQLARAVDERAQVEEALELYIQHTTARLTHQEREAEQRRTHTVRMALSTLQQLHRYIGETLGEAHGKGALEWCASAEEGEPAFPKHRWGMAPPTQRPSEVTRGARTRVQTKPDVAAPDLGLSPASPVGKLLSGVLPDPASRMRTEAVATGGYPTRGQGGRARAMTGAQSLPALRMPSPRRTPHASGAKLSSNAKVMPFAELMSERGHSKVLPNSSGLRIVLTPPPWLTGAIEPAAGPVATAPVAAGSSA